MMPSKRADRILEMARKIISDELNAENHSVNIERDIEADQAYMSSSLGGNVSFPDIHQPVITNTLSTTQLSSTSSMDIMTSHSETDQTITNANPIGNEITFFDTLHTISVIEPPSSLNPPAQLSPTSSMSMGVTSRKVLVKDDMQQQKLIPIESSCQIKPLYEKNENNNENFTADPENLIITEDLLEECQFVFGITDENLRLTNAESQNAGENLQDEKLTNPQKESQQSRQEESYDLSQKELLDEIITEKDENINSETNSVVQREQTIEQSEERNKENDNPRRSNKRTQTILHKDNEKKKRKKNVIPLKERKLIKLRELREKHKVLEGCNKNICKSKCYEKITNSRRHDINKSYWEWSWCLQKTFILNTVSRTNVKRRTTEAGNEVRNHTFHYTFKDEEGEVQSVCKIFYLTTLGYKKTNNWPVLGLFKNTSNKEVIHPQDKRGRASSVNKISDTEILEHIESFNPTISHYRREHAPHVRYLPSDVNISIMHKHFTEMYPNVTCSYELYRLKVKEKNISFTKLGHEECETCEYFRIHNLEHTESSLQEDCQVCQLWSKHIEKSRVSREMYQQNSKNTPAEGTIYFSADLQKVIMLPRVDTFKSVLFTKRIVAYHESFVPLGKKPNYKPFATVWHEGIAGRNKEQIVSTFYAFFQKYRDASTIILWLDNCSSQNKNWTLFTFLIYLINSQEVAINKIILRYFEPGHTFMSADSFHHQVEHSLKKQGKTYDFQDFVDAVQNSNNGNVDVKKMEHSDFYIWKDHMSQMKIKKIVPRPYLADMVEVVAERGNFDLSYKISFAENEWIKLDFLCKKVMKKNGIKRPDFHERPCGIPAEKRDSILTKLKTVLPANRTNFWLNIPISEM